MSYIHKYHSSHSCQVKSTTSNTKPVFDPSINKIVQRKYNFLSDALAYNKIENVSIVFRYKATKRTKENVVREMIPYDIHQCGSYMRFTCVDDKIGYRCFNVKDMFIIDIKISPKQTQLSTLLTLKNLKSLYEMGFTDISKCNQALLSSKSLDEAIAMLISYEELKL